VNRFAYGMILVSGLMCGCTSATGVPDTPAAPTPTVTTPSPAPAPTPAPTPRFTVSGVIHETTPTERVSIAGVRVSIRSGPHDGETTTTDGSGWFAFDGIESPGFSVLMSKPEYDLATFDITSLTHDVQLDVALAPTLVAKIYEFRGNDSCLLPKWNGTPARVVGEIAVHHDGLSSFKSGASGCPCFFDGNEVYVYGKGVDGQVFPVPINNVGAFGSGTINVKAGHVYSLVRAGEGDPCLGNYTVSSFDWTWIAPN
jgi:hypothetical protein